MSKINYKSKYQELKLKFMNSVDVAFRLGYESGMKDAMLENMQQQAAAQAEAAASAAKKPTDNVEGVENTEAAMSADPAGTELDQHIAELESLLGKSELDAESLKKSVQKLKELQEIKKSTKSISNIALALHTPKFKLGTQANANLDSSSKKALSEQQKIVDDIFKAWSREEVKAKKDITDILNIENIIKD